MLSRTVALPVILGAAVLKGARLRRRRLPPGQGTGFVAGTTTSFASTLASQALIRLVERDSALWPYAAYRAGLAGRIEIRNDVAAALSLAGIWLERYLEVVPSINHGAGPAIGLPELGMALFFGGLFLLSWGWFAGRYPIISPRLAADALEREHH